MKFIKNVIYFSVFMGLFEGRSFASTDPRFFEGFVSGSPVSSLREESAGVDVSGGASSSSVTVSAEESNEEEEAKTVYFAKQYKKMSKKVEKGRMGIRIIPGLALLKPEETENFYLIFFPKVEYCSQSLMGRIVSLYFRLKPLNNHLFMKFVTEVESCEKEDDALEKVNKKYWAETLALDKIKKDFLSSLGFGKEESQELDSLASLILPDEFIASVPHIQALFEGIDNITLQKQGLIALKGIAETLYRACFNTAYFPEYLGNCVSEPQRLTNGTIAYLNSQNTTLGKSFEEPIRENEERRAKEDRAAVEVRKMLWRERMDEDAARRIKAAEEARRIKEAEEAEAAAKREADRLAKEAVLREEERKAKAARLAEQAEIEAKRDAETAARLEKDKKEAEARKVADEAAAAVRAAEAKAAKQRAEEAKAEEAQKRHAKTVAAKAERQAAIAAKHKAKK